VHLSEMELQVMYSFICTSWKAGLVTTTADVTEQQDIDIRVLLEKGSHLTMHRTIGLMD